MKLYRVALCLLYLMCTFTVRSYAAESELRTTIATVDAAPMPDWQLPAIDKIQIQPGLHLWVLEDRRLPIVQLMILLPKGTLSDSPDKPGRMALLSTVWRTGGTTTHSPDAFADALERRSISISVEPKPELTLITLSCLKSDLPQALALFQDWFLHPAFDAHRFEIAKRQMKQELLDVKDYPERLAGYLYSSLLYPKDSPWGERTTLADIDRLTRDDITAAYQSLLTSGPVLVGVAGDVTRRPLARFSAALWQGKSIPTVPSSSFVPMAQKTWSSGVTLIAKEGDQSTIFIGHLGDRRSNPDKYALLLANYMLGGDAFSGVLGAELRVARGLVYGVYSLFGFETEYGLFRIYAKTKSSHTQEVLNFIQDSLSKLKKGEPLTAPALDRAKRAVVSDLLFSNEKKGKLLQTLLTFDFYGYEPDYLEQFVDRITAVSLDDVKTVAAQYFYPERLNVLVVGPESLQNQLGPWRPQRVLTPESIIGGK